MADIFEYMNVEPKKDIFDSIDITSKQDIFDKTEASSSLIGRFGKQYYNAAIAAPISAIGTKSNIGRIGAEANSLRYMEEDFRQRALSGKPVTKQEIEDYTKPPSKWSIAGLFKLSQPEWKQQVVKAYQEGRLNITSPETQKEKIKKLTEAIKYGNAKRLQESNVSLAVKEATTLKEKAVDVLAGVGGFTTQLAVLHKAFPGMPEIGIWELQSQVNGETPGSGALTYIAFAAPGKVIPGTSRLARTGRLAAESTLLGGLSAIEQKLSTGEIDWTKVAINAGIPVALRSLDYVKQRLRAGDTKVVEAVNKIQKEATTEETTIETTTKKLQDWAKEPRAFNEAERTKLRKQFRAEQAAGGREQKEIAAELSAQERLRRIKRGFTGKAKFKKFEPPELADKEWNTISQKAEKVYKEDIFKQSDVQDVIDGIREGTHVPTDREFGLLEPILGPDTTMKLYESLSPKRTFSAWDIPKITISAFKSPFGYDPQAARQLSPISFRHPKIYLESVWENVKSYVSKNYAKKLTQKIQDSPEWRLGQEKYKVNYLGIKPWERNVQSKLEQYGDFTKFLQSRKNKVLKRWGALLAASERGANLGIDYGMSRLVGEAEKKLERIQRNRVIKGQPEMTEVELNKYYEDAGKNINAFTKRVVARHPAARQIQNAANYTLFSPAYTVSYPYRSWRTLYSLFRGSPGNRTTAVQYTLSQIAGLSALSYIVASVGHKHRLDNPTDEPPVDSSTNPLDSLWGHVRVNNNVYDLSFGESSYYRLLARVGTSAYLYGKELVTGKQVTSVAGKPVAKAGEELQRYLTSRETVVLGLGKALATGKDWLGNPIDTAFIVNQMMPMSALKDLVDAGDADGLWAAIANGDVRESSIALLQDVPAAASGAFGLGVTSYKVNPSRTRAAYRDIIANQEFKQKWNDLSRKEQAKLKNKYRNSLSKLDEQVKVYKVKHPESLERLSEFIKDEETKAGKIVAKKLTEENRAKVEGISLAVNRSPQNIFLNDDRYNRYLELIAEYLNERLPKIDVEKYNTTVKRGLLTATVNAAKAKAFAQLQREGV